MPISGLTGQNIVESVDSSVCNWYTGPTLIEILDQMPIEPRNAVAPLRIPVLDKMKEGNRSIIFGKVEQGENGSEIKHEGKKKSIKLLPLHFTLQYIYLFHNYSFLVDLTVEIDEQNEIGTPKNLEGSH